MNAYRTHLCATLGPSDQGAQVTLSGWLHRVRPMGELLFLVLRDSSGLVQLVLDPGDAVCDEATLKALRPEATIRARGVVRLRPEGAHNDQLQTGQIEVALTQITILGACGPLPYSPHHAHEASEAERLRYRFLELREQGLHQRIVTRSHIISAMREAMTQRGFLELQTPILTASSPEGARDFLVPSRHWPGRFYALPQAPQQFKQLLMASGFERYFQIAPCFRDEDGRQDRSAGEFYQLDLEMAFVEQEDIFALVEPMMIELFERFSGWSIPRPFPRIPYHEAISRFGIDKPDLRFGMELQDVTQAFEGSDVELLREGIARGQRLKALVAPGYAQRPRRAIEALEAFMKGQQAPGLIWLVPSEDEAQAWRGPLARRLSQPEREALRALPGAAEPGAMIMMALGPHERACAWMGRLRLRLGHELGLIQPEVFRFCWVVDFPMYERDEQTGQIVFSHNPFSMPQGGMQALERQDPLTILAHQYDLVCNGLELSSGAIRNHRPEVMVKAFELAGYTAQDVEERFGALYKAFHYGPPPHGGMAPGIDRIVMLLTGADHIRDVVAFPMTSRAQDLLMGAPSKVRQAQLDELRLQVLHTDEAPDQAPDQAPEQA